MSSPIVPQPVRCGTLAVGFALVIGRTEVMAKASMNKPIGIRYNKALNEWLRANCLAEVPAQERYRVPLILEN